MVVGSLNDSSSVEAIVSTVDQLTEEAFKLASSPTKLANDMVAPLPTLTTRKSAPLSKTKD